MILNIYNQNHQIDIPLGTINQWCGFNVQQKRRIIDMLCKYFSTYKYQQFESDLLDKIRVDGEKVGRKYIEVFLIKDKEMLLDTIANTKIGLLSKILKKKVECLENVTQMDAIDNILLSIYENINEQMAQLGDVAIEYERESLWSIIQKSMVKTKDGRYLEELSNWELIDIYINSLNRVQKEECGTKVVIFENIDHMISAKQYQKLLGKFADLAYDTNISFVFSISLPDYLVLNESNVEDITIFNEMVYSLPDLNHISEFIAQNYPNFISLDQNELEKVLAKAALYINYSNGIFQSLSEPIIARLISETNGVNQEVAKHATKPEIAYFFD